MSWKAWKADCEPRLLPGSQAIDMALELQQESARTAAVDGWDTPRHHRTLLNGCHRHLQCHVAGMAWCWKWCGEASRRHHFSCPGITKQSWWMKRCMFLATFASIWWGFSARKLESYPWRMRLEWSTNLIHFFGVSSVNSAPAATEWPAKAQDRGIFGAKVWQASRRLAISASTRLSCCSAAGSAWATGCQDRSTLATSKAQLLPCHGISYPRRICCWPYRKKTWEIYDGNRCLFTWNICRNM